jgi:hypothetical protein
MRSYTREKTEYKIYKVTDFGKNLIDQHYDKSHAIKKASELAYGNRNLITTEWEVEKKDRIAFRCFWRLDESINDERLRLRIKDKIILCDTCQKVSSIKTGENTVHMAWLYW